MTTLLDVAVPPATEPPARRWRWRWTVAGLVVVVLAATSIGGLIYARTYQPLAEAGTLVPATPATIKPISDGQVDTRLILLGKAGTIGSVDYALRNNGSHPVRLLGLDTAQEPLAVTGLQWLGLSVDNHGDGSTFPVLRETHAFPVTLNPGESVFIQLSVEKPRCAQGSFEQVEGIPIRWSAYGVSHVWTFALSAGNDGDNTALPVSVCPSKAAVALIDKRL